MTFQVHRKIREDSDMAQDSLQCLAQLASMHGPIFPDESAQVSYLAHLVEGLLSMINGSVSPHWENCTFNLLEALISSQFCGQRFVEVIETMEVTSHRACICRSHANPIILCMVVLICLSAGWLVHPLLEISHKLVGGIVTCIHSPTENKTSWL